MLRVNLPGRGGGLTSRHANPPSQAPYSLDANLFHTSYESGMLEDPMTAPVKVPYLAPYLVPI